jgi:hypothetical protein
VFAKESVSQPFDLGIRDGIDLRIEIAHSPYVTRKSFLAYLRDVMVPSIKSNWNLPGCSEKSSIIFWDDCSDYCSEDIFEKLTNHEILLITYPPLTMPISQVLDVLLFGRLKSANKYLPRDDNQDPQVDHAMRDFLTYEIVTTSNTVRGSWEKADFGLVKRDDTYYLWINEGKIWTNPEFVEMWQIDYPDARLSQ